MDHELVGSSGDDSRPAGRRRPAAGGPFALLTLLVALLPIRPVWLWAALVAAAAAAPWALGALRGRRPRPYWRLSAAGLERVGPGGTVLTRYERSRIVELALTVDDGALIVFHKFGRVSLGKLTRLGFDPASFFVTARRLGIPIHVLTGDAAGTEDGTPPPDRAAERRLLDLEADLLAAAHTLEPAPAGPGAPVELASMPTEPSPGRVAALGVLAGLLAGIGLVRAALTGPLDLADRITAGCWAAAGLLVVLLTQRWLARHTPVRWTIGPDAVRIRYGRADGPSLRSVETAALVVGSDPLGGRDPAITLAFDHRLRLLARLPARGLDPFQLAHALDERGYRVVSPDVRVPRPSAYGLDELPEIFAQVPGGRLTVDGEGLGWADGAGDVVLRMPDDRIGGLELLTISGHAWLRVYDSDGDEFFAAPLSALRISRTDLRDSARRAGLPVTDAEYDAYLSAAFHGAVSALSADPPPPDPAPPGDSGVTLDATRRSRLLAYAATVLLCEVVAVLGALWLGDDLGGFGTTLAWAAPLGLLVGLAGSWRYDRDRDRLRVSAAEIAVVTGRGRVAWRQARSGVGGVGIDDSQEGPPRLVVWSPAGRVLRRVSLPPDLGELRRVCERYGLPWGPPDAHRPASPPPEL
ncbi:hypothetical protein DPM19_06790 [Actinomadura craniellae]|uniref:Uncharacterized protein n=1 Tax=Actinomadura craniellae TaxID=2231787 RepID=A0A365H8U3_9ACTN|nr:hypothetical protein [Actinomadura craniellae]RAY15507.1 hypothetical protein DPM19_06790 [Actinomadura craniellae]